jgi:hypothetical protein
MPTGKPGVDLTHEHHLRLVERTGEPTEVGETHVPFCSTSSITSSGGTRSRPWMMCRSPNPGSGIGSGYQHERQQRERAECAPSRHAPPPGSESTRDSVDRKLTTEIRSRAAAHGSSRIRRIDTCSRSAQFCRSDRPGRGRMAQAVRRAKAVPAPGPSSRTGWRTPAPIGGPTRSAAATGARSWLARSGGGRCPWCSAGPTSCW